MIVSFTQTYGNRQILLDIYVKDKRLIEFKNLFDLNIYSFHNCNPSLIEKFKQTNKVKNTKILIYNGIHYGESIRQTKTYLKSIGCTHFFFSQDDSFSADNNDTNFNELISTISSFNNNFMLSLYHKALTGNIIVDNETFKIYENTTLSDNISRSYALDDTPYICTVDILDLMYDEKYLNIKNIWDAELYIGKKFKTIKLNRFVTNKRLFKNYNIIGRTIKYKHRELTELKIKGFIDI